MDKPGFKTAGDFGDPNKFYRVFSGNQAYEDILESGKIRTLGSPSYKGTNPHLSEHPSLLERIKSRPTAWPSFARGKADLSYARELPDHYIIETEEKLITPKSGRHGPGSTYFPMDEKGLDVDKTKTKIYKHLGEGKYEQVRSTNKGLEKNLVPPTAERLNAAIEASKERSARGLEKNIVSSTAGKAAPMETPYGKSLLSYTPEGKIAGKTGAALRGLGKLASRVASPIGAALTAIDLGQALSEVQDKGAAKIAEDYRKEQERKALAESEDMGDKVIEKMNPIQSNSKQYSLEENFPSSAKSQLGSGARRDYQSSKYSGNLSMKDESTGYSPEERVKLKDMLSKYRATPTLR